MKKAFVLARKDMISYFHSWTGVMIFTFFFIIAGIMFSFLVTTYAKLSLGATSQNALDAVQGLNITRFVFSSFFLNLGAILIFLIPLLSMRAFSEERKQGTMELLFTYPLTDFDIVWGKFLSMVWFLEALMLPTLGYFLLLHLFGAQLDLGPMAIAYLGFWLLGTAYLSLGLFVSSISENQVISALATFGLLTVFWVLDWAASVSDGFWGVFLGACSPLTHYREFTIGVLDLSNLAYFLFFHLFFLFLTMRAIETRNWKA